MVGPAGAIEPEQPPVHRGKVCVAAGSRRINRLLRGRHGFGEPAGLGISCRQNTNHLGVLEAGQTTGSFAQPDGFGPIADGRIRTRREQPGQVAERLRRFAASVAC